MAFVPSASARHAHEHRHAGQIFETELPVDVVPIGGRLQDADAIHPWLFRSEE